MAEKHTHKEPTESEYQRLHEQTICNAFAAQILTDYFCNDIVRKQINEIVNDIKAKKVRLVFRGEPFPERDTMHHAFIFALSQASYEFVNEWYCTLGEERGEE